MVPLRALVAVAIVAAAGTGCVDRGKLSEERATRWVATVAKTATDEIALLEVGLPLGARQFAPLYAHGADATDDLAGVRSGLLRVRGVVPELKRSDSSFFALTTANGLTIRNDLEQDVMAGQDAWKLFPKLREAKSGHAVVDVGLFGGSHPSEPDRDWVMAAPVNDDAGKFVGTLMGGWTLRRFAFHLQDSLRHALADDQEKSGGTTKLPIVYVSVFDPAGVVSAPFMPTLDQQALVDLGLLAQTRAAGSVAHGRLSVEGREFGWAATRVAEFEPEGGVVLLWSEI